MTDPPLPENISRMSMIDVSGEQSDLTAVYDGMVSHGLHWIDMFMKTEEQIRDGDSLRDSFNRQGRFRYAGIRPVTDGKLPLSSGPNVARTAFYDATEGSDLIEMGWKVGFVRDDNSINLTHPSNGSRYWLEILDIWEDGIFNAGRYRMTLLTGTLWSSPAQVAPQECDGEYLLIPNVLVGTPSNITDPEAQIKWYVGRNDLETTRSIKRKLAGVQED